MLLRHALLLFPVIITSAAFAADTAQDAPRNGHCYGHASGDRWGEPWASLGRTLMPDAVEAVRCTTQQPTL